jgi:hypothetical protein
MKTIQPMLKMQYFYKMARRSSELTCTCVHACSENSIGVSGWELVMAGAVRCSELTVLNPLGTSWIDLKQGTLEELNLGCKMDAGLVVACTKCYLSRSATCLTLLDIRWVDSRVSMKSNKESMYEMTVFIGDHSEWKCSTF